MGSALDELMTNLKGLPPGFRFNPTDEELICDYLSKKSSKCSKHAHLDLMITDIDIYKYEPFDLPGMSCFQGGNDKQWFFFTHGDSKKYTKGSRVNRTTQSGYWKATGKDCKVLSNGVLVGKKKTLVFYRGRGTESKRTDWFMYEYKLVSDNAVNAKFCSSGKESRKKDSFVLCRVCLKDDSKKKTKEQHGDSCQGEKSTYEGSAVATEKEQHENVVTSTSKEVEIKDRDLPFGPFIASSEENSISRDDDLQKFLLECLCDPVEEQTGHGLLQVSEGDAQPNLFDDIYAYAKDTVIQNDEASICNVPTDVLMHGDTSEPRDLDGFPSPSVLAGDFLELNDLILPW